MRQRFCRAFKAYLAKGKDGKVSFEFEPRKEKSPAKGKGSDNAATDLKNEDDVANPIEAVTKKPARKAAGSAALKTSKTLTAPRKPAVKKLPTKAAPKKKAAGKKVAAKKITAKKIAA